MPIFYRLFRRKNTFQFFNIACVWSVLMTPKSVKDIQRNKLQCLSTATHKNTQLVLSPLKTATCKKRPRTTKWDQLQEYTFGSSLEKSVSLVYYTNTLGKKNHMIQSGGTRKQLTNSAFSFIEMQQS